MHILLSTLPYVLIAVEIALFSLVMRDFNAVDKRKLAVLQEHGVADAIDIVETTAAMRIALYGLVCGFPLFMQVIFMFVRDHHWQFLFYVFGAVFITPLAVTLSMLRRRRI